MSSNRATSVHNYLQTAVKIRQSVEGAPEALLKWRPGPGKWSIHEVIVHLIDSNIVNSYRIRKIISEPTTDLVTFAHEDWIRSQRLDDVPVAELLEAYDAITRYNGLLLQRLADEDWNKFGMKPNEPISVGHIVDQFICNHVEKHLGQIERNKAAYVTASASEQ